MVSNTNKCYLHLSINHHQVDAPPQAAPTVFSSVRKKMCLVKYKLNVVSQRGGSNEKTICHKEGDVSLWYGPHSFKVT